MNTSITLLIFVGFEKLSVQNTIIALYTIIFRILLPTMLLLFYKNHLVTHFCEISYQRFQMAVILFKLA